MNAVKEDNKFQIDFSFKSNDLNFLKYETA